MADYRKKGASINFSKLTGYLLGAGVLAGLGGAGWTPLLATVLGLVILRRILKDVF